jgi:hypothetical protein
LRANASGASHRTISLPRRSGLLLLAALILTVEMTYKVSVDSSGGSVMRLFGVDSTPPPTALGRRDRTVARRRLDLQYGPQA